MYNYLYLRIHHLTFTILVMPIRIKFRFGKLEKLYSAKVKYYIWSLKILRTISDYYQANFKDVYEFASLGGTNLPDEFIQFGNKARLVLESHARTHYKLEYATSAVIKKFKNTMMFRLKNMIR